MQHWTNHAEDSFLKLAFPSSISLDASSRMHGPEARIAMAGHGIIEVESHDGRTFLSRLRGQSPLKLLTPRKLPSAIRVILGSHGGGLVAGDNIQLDVAIGKDAALYLGTQASTKVYRSQNGNASRQLVQLNMGPGSICVILPDPVTPFEQAIYQQRFQAHLAGDSTLVLLDWFTAGRGACGERWDFSRYTLRSDIFVSGRQIFRDALRLDAADGPLNHPARTGGYDCLGSLVLLGPRLTNTATELLDAINQTAVERNQRLVYSASPIAGGCIVRFAGATTELVGRWLRDRLTFVGDLLGEDPWARKY